MISDVVASPYAMQMWITLGLTAAVVVLYVTEWVSLELTSLGLIAALMVLFHLMPVQVAGSDAVLDATRLLSGFGNPALIAVLALLVVGEALVRTGALDSAAALFRHPKIGPRIGLMLALVVVACLSAFLNNTPVVVIFIPIIQSLAREMGTAPSRVMMPLSFAAILGGMTTLIGSSTNLLVSNALYQMGEPRLGFFEFTGFGVALAGVGFAYMLLVGPRLMPKHQSLTGQVTRGGQQFISQIVVPEDSALVGQTAVAGHFRGLPDVTIRMIQRGNHAELPPFDDFHVRAGDILIIAAPRAALAEIATRHPGHLHPPTGEGADLMGDRVRSMEGDVTGTPDAGQATDQVLAEAMVPPSSRMVGQSLEQYGFHQRYHCVAVGVLRRARMIRARLSDIRLEAGDVLLVQGRPNHINRLRAERDLVMVSGTTDVLPKRDKAGLAATVFGVAVGLAAVGLVPIVVAALVAATLLIALGALNLRQAVRAIDRKIVLVVAAALALGEALFHTGGAAYVAHAALSLVGTADPLVVLGGFFLVVAAFTNLLSNNACAVLFTPIGYGLAAELGIDPRLFAITVVLAANCSFASPIGYKTNLLVMGPGQYAFMDFVKVGLPLVLVLWVAFMALAPMFWAL
ncbi:MAG: potassium transporter TrkA [Rhodospirillaceae bacterium BRH_c57]|nr:MAG: potassium transporter TrkA [Rhodospirillaceae bacterium BRH_c57]